MNFLFSLLHIILLSAISLIRKSKEILLAVIFGLLIFFLGESKQKNKEIQEDLENVREIERRRIKRDSDSISDVDKRLLGDARKS